MSFMEVLSIAFTSKELSTRQKWILGLINLSSVVVFWVLSSFLVNDLFGTDIYRKPFFITYINTGCFAFYLLPYLYHEDILFAEFFNRVKESYALERKQKNDRLLYIRLSTNLEGAGYGSSDDLSGLELQTHTSIESQLGGLAVAGSNRAIFEGLGPDSPPSGSITPIEQTSSTKTLDNTNAEIEIPLYETIKLSLQFSILWFSANLVTNASLSYTSVASQTILSSTSSFFTLIVGFICSVEKININKVVGLVLSFIGVIIVTKIDSNDPPSSISPLSTLWGNLLALSGALFYGVYTILLKFKVMIKNSNKERVLNTHLFFAFVGIFSLVLLWPLLFILDVTGQEKFELPSTSYVYTLLTVNCLITFVSDLCWCKAVLLTSPLTVTVGLSMTIPLAMIGDWLIKGFKVNILYLLGASVVTIGFLIINKDEEGDFVHSDD